MHPEESQGNDLTAALRALRRRRGLIVLCFLVLGGSALLFSLISTPQYSATASLLFRDPGFDQRIFGSSSFVNSDPTRDAATNVALVGLDVVAERTAAKLGDGETQGAVSSSISVNPGGDSNVVSVVATDPSPDQAAKIANTFALSFIAFRRQADRDKVAQARRLVQSDYNKLSPTAQSGEEGQSLQRQISQLQTLEALQTGNAELVQKATPPGSPSSPKTLRNTVLGFLLGGLLGIGLALLFERLDRRLKEPDDIGATFGLPVLAGVPDSKTLVDPEFPELTPAETEAFRMLRTRLRYFNVDRDVRCMLVTSASAGDGKSTVSWNVALSAAESGSTVALLEADFHRPTMAERQRLSPLPGLAELLTNQATLEQATQTVSVAGHRNGSESEHSFDVIVAGATPPNPTQIMESAEMAKLMAELRDTYDMVVIDTPPAAVVADAIPLMRLVDGVIIVGQIGKTTRDEAAHMRIQLAELGAPTLGVVANRVSARGYYGYYSQDTGTRSGLLGLRVGRGS